MNSLLCVLVSSFPIQCVIGSMPVCQLINASVNGIMTASVDQCCVIWSMPVCKCIDDNVSGLMLVCQAMNANVSTDQCHCIRVDQDVSHSVSMSIPKGGQSKHAIRTHTNTPQNPVLNVNRSMPLWQHDCVRVDQDMSTQLCQSGSG